MQQFPSNDIKNILTSHMISISLNDFFKLDDVFFNELSSTLLCAFVDIMRLSAPNTIGSDQTMKYYLTYLTKYLKTQYNRNGLKNDKIEDKKEE